MCDELDLDSYGDVDYVPHVLRYYIANQETTVSNESAKSILEELKKNNTAPSQAWEVIEKGASLIGNVEYSMEKDREMDGIIQNILTVLRSLRGHFISQG